MQKLLEHHMTQKTLLINYVIGNNKKRRNLQEETRITRIRWKTRSRRQLL